MDFMNQKISKSWSQFKRFKGSPQEDKYFQKTPQISGEVISESFLEGEIVSGGIFSKKKKRYPHGDEYIMSIKTDDKKTLSYTFHGVDARKMDLLYNPGSRAEGLPPKTINGLINGRLAQFGLKREVNLSK